MATIDIKKINIVASWDYTSKNKECVCNRSLHLPTVGQVEKQNIYRNDISFGECGHAYHTECINAYLKAYGGMCPCDRLNWTTVKNDYKIKYSILK